METTLWSPYLATLSLATLALLILSKFLHRKKLNPPPPRPKPWPIIGNLAQMGTLPHRSIHQLSLKHGPLKQLKFGSIPVVVGSNVEMARIFLKTMDLTCVGRPKTAAGKYTTFNYFVYGPYWRQARRMCMTELLSPKRLESYEYIRREEMHWLVKGLYMSCGEDFVLKDRLLTLSLNVIGRMVLGKNYMDGLDESRSIVGSIVEPEEFKKMDEELFVLNGVLNVGDYVKWVLGFARVCERMKVLSKKFDS